MKKHHVIGAALAALLFAVASVTLSWFAEAWWHGPVALVGGIAFVFAAFACVALLDNP